MHKLDGIIKQEEYFAHQLKEIYYREEHQTVVSVFNVSPQTIQPFQLQIPAMIPPLFNLDLHWPPLLEGEILYLHECPPISRMVQYSLNPVGIFKPLDTGSGLGYIQLIQHSNLQDLDCWACKFHPLC